MYIYIWWGLPRAACLRPLLYMNVAERRTAFSFPRLLLCLWKEEERLFLSYTAQQMHAWHINIFFALSPLQMHNNKDNPVFMVRIKWSLWACFTLTIILMVMIYQFLW